MTSNDTHRLRQVLGKASRNHAHSEINPLANISDYPIKLIGACLACLFFLSTFGPYFSDRSNPPDYIKIIGTIITINNDSPFHLAEVRYEQNNTHYLLPCLIHDEILRDCFKSDGKYIDLNDMIGQHFLITMTQDNIGGSQKYYRVKKLEK